MNDGIYRLYHCNVTNHMIPIRNLVARFLIHGGSVYHMEDHYHTLPDHIPEGPIDEATIKRLELFRESPYYNLTNEDDIENGTVTADIPEMDVGPVAPDAKYQLMVPGEDRQLSVEVHGETVFVEGRELSQPETEQLFQQLQGGALQLIGTAPMQKGERTLGGPELIKLVNRSGKSHFQSKDGVRIWATGTPQRAEYDKAHVAELHRVFGAGKKMTPVTVPLDKIITANNVYNQDRYNMYLRMARSGEPLPPVVFSRRGISTDKYYLPDGNHRYAAAKQAGLKELTGYLVEEEPMEKRPKSKR